MDSNSWFDTAFDGRPLMAILRGFDLRRTVELAERAWDVGMDWVEVPIQSASGVEALAATVEAGRGRGLAVAAGTVTTRERVRQAAGAGAAFAVAPGLDPDVATASLEAGLPYLPGVATASDIQAADRLGLRWLKAFPAAVLGAGWIKLMHGPFPQARFVATGGVDAANARRFLDAGARVVGVGSALEDPSQLDRLAALRQER
ncbi:bifunctional 4-hydroxy-2-oxoglutarate aldolase/2-dehydro-3-deoxy-phosphogluconate aldolase [Streptomyces sp. CBMA156]|uniref:bifunctional 4-hydroxy-2-oxoglutarate aldolase/2-dehydro-3-deoxy-phosphogluconate aldolase n=1 Tax=Streptomyces sp. CBMA156 TaxID=1930280 RepID=UPI001661B8E3|nr:bifunctional 4-hydroxy-2-oxoglutarate aldolase/2-dehydro-3-deoxy-phosphogluconate aldolase [Streptomyces sp. CBMA156]MBD0673726.1 2-dehydro-3-deoxyphosphogluconate aldolase [Streptomyces sp. CBMA156]